MKRTLHARLAPNANLQQGRRHADLAALVAACLVCAAGVAYADSVETVVVEGLKISGPGVLPGGTGDYTVTAADIAALPAGDNTAITDVLAQMPGVAIDQNQQIHIRDTEGPQFQYQIDGILVPLDINTNPPFVSMINPMFIERLNLLTGILPAQYSYATGGIVDIETRNGCEHPGGSASVMFGQRELIQPSAEYAGCDGPMSYFGSLLYSQSNMAFSSATPGPNAIHNYTNQGQVFGELSYAIDADTQLKLIASVSASDNQLPNVPGLTPAFTLAGANPIPSAQIDSRLDFRDYLGIVSLSGTRGEHLSYRLAYAAHAISEEFFPDDVGELIYQGVASTASHKDMDNTFQGDVSYGLGPHTLGAGFYVGLYDVTADDNSLVFPVDTSGNQSSDIPVRVINNASKMNVISGVYVNDLWQIEPALAANLGLRFDSLTGFTSGTAVDPTINFSWTPWTATTLHAGFARYMQVPSFQGISPTAPAAFAGTTAEGPPGVPTPLVERDSYWDAGIAHTFAPGFTVSEDNFYEITKDYLDTGQFGVVPIFAPFNYSNGFMWGAELAAAYRASNLSTYINLTLGKNLQQGVDTGQFNFDPDELAYINAHHINLDHQPFLGITAGTAYTWKPLTFTADLTYSSGLAGGFADLEHLPYILQVNVGVEGTLEIPGVGPVSDRLTFLNILDRTDLIRPAEGIGVFQSAYEPRFTVFDTVTFPF